MLHCRRLSVLSLTRSTITSARPLDIHSLDSPKRAAALLSVCQPAARVFTPHTPPRGTAGAGAGAGLARQGRRGHTRNGTAPCCRQTADGRCEGGTGGKGAGSTRETRKRALTGMVAAFPALCFLSICKPPPPRHDTTTDSSVQCSVRGQGAACGRLCVFLYEKVARSLLATPTFLPTTAQITAQ